MEVKIQDHEELQTPPLVYNQPSPAFSSLASTVGESTDHRSFAHGNTSLNPPPQTLDQARLPFQYSLRPRRDHPQLDPDPDSSPATAPPSATTAPSIIAVSSPVRYRECLKNHAAKNGWHALDGCGEFMPSGEDGTPESFKCAACECHRNFHRRETEAETPHSLTYYYNYPCVPNSRRSFSESVVPSAPPYSHFNRSNHHQPPSVPVGPPIGPVMMAFGGSAEAPAESSSDGLDMYHQSTVGAEASGQPKKRFRTKFSGEQKAKMMGFANKLGWKIQKHDEQEVQQFCTEIGVKRQIFKVWMHNNKQPTKNN